MASPSSWHRIMRGLTPDSMWEVGLPVKIAVAWSINVVLGCFFSLTFVDFGTETMTEFVVLVRNIMLMGAAAIALPVSMYMLWVRDKSFRMDFSKAVREEIERQRREEAEEIERQETDRRETELRRDEAKKQRGEKQMVSLLRKMSDAADGAVHLRRHLGMGEEAQREFHIADLLVDRGLAERKSDSMIRITAAGYDFLNKHGENG